MVLNSFSELRGILPHTRKEYARSLRMIDLRKLNHRDLVNDSRILGICGNGGYETLIARIQSHIWQQVYDR